MKKASRIALTVALILILSGIVLILIGGASIGFDFTRLNSSEPVSSTHEVADSFTSISVRLNVSDLRVARSEDGSCRVESLTWENTPHTVRVENGMLIIEETDARAWYEHVGIHIGSPEITLYLPQQDLESLQIETDTGDVSLLNTLSLARLEINSDTGDVAVACAVREHLSVITDTGDVSVIGASPAYAILQTDTGEVSFSGAAEVGDLTVITNTGDVSLTELTVASLTAKTTTGDQLYRNLMAAGALQVRATTGDVELWDCDASAVLIETTTGDVSGHFKTEKRFVTNTSTGDVTVPSTEGGVCEIRTSTGDIRFR